MSRRSSGQRGNTQLLSLTGAPYAVISGALSSAASSLVPKAVTAAGESFATWYYQREYVKSYGAIAGPIILAGTTLTLSQVGQITNIVKSIAKVVWRKEPQSISPGTQQKYEYAAVIEKKGGIPWEKLALLLSLISLKFPAIEPRVIPLSKGIWFTPEVRPRRLGLLYLAFLVLRWCGRTWWSRFRSPIGATLTTRLIQATLEKTTLNSSQQRQVFVDMPVVRSTPTENHTHAISARDRNAGGATAELMARSLGLEPYFVQLSLADERKGRKGDRSFHWAKDLAVAPAEHAFDSTKQASVFVDVDYYIDMPQFLADNPGTHFISTFQPTTVAEGKGEYTFRFLKDDRVQYNVSGGAEYIHEVWDYSGETLVVESQRFSEKRVVAYHIDRKHIDPHHSVIMLTVLGKFGLPPFLPSSSVISGGTLTRIKPVCGSHVVLDIVRTDGLYRSIAIYGSHLAVTLPKVDLDAVHAVAIVSKCAITQGMVDSNISPAKKNGMPEYKLAPGHSAIIASYLREGVPMFPPMVHPPSECVLAVWYDKYGHESRIPLAGFGSPLMGPNYVHASDLASDNQCIAGRVEAFTKDHEESVMRPSLASYMAEFAQFVIPDHVAHTGSPVSNEDVHERQDRPSQRNILNQAESSGLWYKKLFRTFVKVEEYQKVTDPRNITTVTPEAKLKNSRFMYSFHDGVMSRLDNYAFNKTPKEIAEKVASILKDAAFSVMGDGNRFDGHVKRFARILERVLMFRWFKKEWHSELNETLDEQIGMPGITKWGRKFASFFTRGSGTLETSDFNSILSMFIAYCAWRNTRIEGVKCTPEEAWARLGIYGGDDSLEGAVDPTALRKAAAMMGQDYDITVVFRGSRGVNFLNRWFGPDVWNGDCNSMANPKRLLTKLWIGPANLPEPLQRFAERISGYYRMDRNSPVIGSICQVSHELLGERVDGELMPWDGRHSLESNWPNMDSGWMIDQFLADIPDFDFDRFNMHIATIRLLKDPSLLLQFPLCTPDVGTVNTSKVACVVGDEFLEPTQPAEQEEGGCNDPTHKGKNEAGEACSECETLMFADESTDVSLGAIEEQLNKIWPVTAAEDHVPFVDKKGLKTKNDGGPKTRTKTVNKAKKQPFDSKRPDLWTPPKDPAALPGWLKLRAKVAKRLKIDLTEKPVQINGNQGSWTNSDDTSQRCHWRWCACDECLERDDVLYMGREPEWTDHIPDGVYAEWNCPLEGYSDDSQSSGDDNGVDILDPEELLFGPDNE